MNQRTEAFARNPRLEALLKSLNERLEPAGDALSRSFEAPRRPVVLIMGCARSGTTLLLQWLASLDLFWYPTNFVSRFYATPAIGRQIQAMLLDDDLAFGQEMEGALTGRQESSLGKTAGWLEPSEFWYFWRQHFFRSATESVDGNPPRNRFLAELAALEADSGRPLAMKGLIANAQISALDALLPKAIFIHLRRDARFTAQSLLESRVAHTGNEAHWYSFKTPGYERLRGLEPLAQVAGQVRETHRLVEAGLASVAPERQLTLEYEGFCEDPGAAYAELHARFQRQGDEGLPAECPVVKAFTMRNEQRLEDERWRRLEALLVEAESD